MPQDVNLRGWHDAEGCEAAESAYLYTLPITAHWLERDECMHACCFERSSIASVAVTVTEDVSRTIRRRAAAPEGLSCATTGRGRSRSAPCTAVPLPPGAGVTDPTAGPALHPPLYRHP